jgi:hypothetical protein
MKKQKIRKHYYEYVMANKLPPKKLKKFLAFAELSKEDFHVKYESLHAVELDIWKHGLKDVLGQLGMSNEFSSYNQRDRGLAFMYSWFEFMDENRRYFRNCSSMQSSNFMYGSSDFKKILKSFVKKIIKEGMACQEFKQRGMSEKYMCDFFSGLFFMNLKQWKRCKLKNKQKKEEYMDALLEKSMIFFFDSLAPNLFDTFVDLMKHRQSK